MIRFTLGELRLTVLSGGRLRLDGGAMFGTVPKALWERQRPADSRNRIALAMNLLLIEDGRQRILLDTGAGTAWDEKGTDRYGLETFSAARILGPAGLRPDQVDVVVNSHLHFDHAGGNTERLPDGRFTAAYPNARYVVQQGELRTAREVNERTRLSYRSQDFEPLESEGRLSPVDGSTRLTPYLELCLAPGHTPFHQVAVVRTREGTVAFLGDLVPTASHVPYPYIMAYDLEPLVTLASKKRLLPEAAREGWYLVFEHDEQLPLGVLQEREGRLEARPAPVEA